MGCKSSTAKTPEPAVLKAGTNAVKNNESQGDDNKGAPQSQPAGDIYIKTLADFEALKKGSKPLVVDFTASWCPPCKRIGPIFEAKVAEYPELVMKKCDVDEASEVAQAVGIRSMPTFMVFKGGEQVDEMSGANEQGLIEMLNKAKA